MSKAVFRFLAALSFLIASSVAGFADPLVTTTIISADTNTPFVYTSTTTPTNPVSLFIGGGGQHVTHTTGLEGYYDLCLGFRCMTSITTGSYNHGAGFETLEDLTTGSWNTAWGEAAGVYLSDGNRNSLFGWKAGLGPVHDAHYSEETLLGYGVGIGDRTGYGNTGSGSFSMGGGSISGAYNTGGGSRSLYSLTSGSNNATSGALSGFNINAANNNTLMGFSAGSDLTTGSYNVIIGAVCQTPVANDNYVVTICDGAGRRRMLADAAGWKFYAADGTTVIGHFP